MLRQFQGALEKFDVKSFESAGQPFDPALHEAVSQKETDEQPAGTIVSEYQKGYLVGAKLLRPAMVVVAKPKPDEATGPNGKDRDDDDTAAGAGGNGAENETGEL